jgi:hypothetical protein
MTPNISEFSYGYALTNDLMRRYSLNSEGAPRFPSLRQEGQTGGGYDVELPRIALFLQFKLSRYMKGGRAKYANLVGLHTTNWTLGREDTLCSMSFCST